MPQKSAKSPESKTFFKAKSYFFPVFETSGKHPYFSPAPPPPPAGALFARIFTVAV